MKKFKYENGKVVDVINRHPIYCSQTYGIADVNHTLLHKKFEIDEKVEFSFCENSLTGTGTIVGISSFHVINIYIVLLDVPLTAKGYEGWRALCIPGPYLRSI